MNSAELRAAVRARNGIATTGEGLAGHTDIDEAIVAALSDIAGEHRWPWLATSTTITFQASDGKSASLPAFTQIRALEIGEAPVPSVSLDEFLQRDRLYVYADLGDALAIYPTPETDTSATLYFFQPEPALETDESSPLLPEAWHRVLVARASYHLNARRGRSDGMQRDLAEYQTGLANMMASQRRSTGPRAVRSAFRNVRTPRW